MLLLGGPDLQFSKQPRLYYQWDVIIGMNKLRSTACCKLNFPDRCRCRSDSSRWCCAVAVTTCRRIRRKCRPHLRCAAHLLRRLVCYSCAWWHPRWRLQPQNTQDTINFISMNYKCLLRFNRIWLPMSGVTFSYMGDCFITPNLSATTKSDKPCVEISPPTFKTVCE